MFVCGARRTLTYPDQGRSPKFCQRGQLKSGRGRDSRGFRWADRIFLAPAQQIFLRAAQTLSFKKQHFPTPQTPHLSAQSGSRRHTSGIERTMAQPPPPRPAPTGRRSWYDAQSLSCSLLRQRPAGLDEHQKARNEARSRTAGTAAKAFERAFVSEPDFSRQK